MSHARQVSPPRGGMPPPQAATLPGGTSLDLRALAQQISDAHLARHPEDLERYGDAAREWCVHDNQHLLSWAALDLSGRVDFDAQLQWLARVLAARGYPVENLVDNLRAGHDVLMRGSPDAGRQALADRLAAAADSLGA